MLMDRLYEPAESDLVYHYCSAATFQIIATSGTIRFSDINMLNDEAECHWAYSVFEEAATRLIKRVGIPPSFPAIDISFIESIDEIISPVQLVVHPFIACFSLESDSLSQWRAYADDGRGFSVGFHGRTLKRQLPATFLNVLYDRELQVSEMMMAIGAIFMRQQEEAEDRKQKFFEDCVLLGTYMVAFKHPAFEHEQEVRAVHAINIERIGNSAKFVDAGGIIDGDIEVAGNPVSFQVRDNHLAAFTDAKLAPSSPESPITELVLGPKNHSSPGNLFLFLGGVGITEISLRKSLVPYR